MTLSGKKMICAAAAGVLLFSGGVVCGNKLGKNTVSTEKISSPSNLVSQKPGQASQTPKQFSTGTQLVSPTDNTLEEQMLRMIVNNEEPNTNFGEEKYIEYEKLPAIIRNAGKGYYESRSFPDEKYLVAIYQYDLDHDGHNELIASFWGDQGNGSYGYHVFACHQGKWLYSGQVFGITVTPMSHNGRHGIYEKYRCGGSIRFYSFHELVNGKLVKSVEIKAERETVDKSKPRLNIKLKTKSGFNFFYIF